MSTAKKPIRHAFIDESERRNSGFMLCAVTVVEGNVAAYRTQLMALRPKRATRIHMKSVSADGDRMRIITAVAELEAHSTLYVVKKTCKAREARDIALGSAFADLSGMGVTRVVIESCDQDLEDRRIIRRTLGADPDLHYDLEPASMNNPLLWLPDVHAWAWGRGGKFKSAIEHRITEIRAP